MILCNMRGAAKYYVFVVDNENDLIIKSSCFFLLQSIVPLMEWFGWSTSFSPTLFVLFVSNPKLKSQNLVGILNGFHCDHFGSVESEWTRVSEIRFDPVCFLNTQTLSICQETNNGKCLSLFNLVYYLIFHHHVIHDFPFSTDVT